MMGFLYISIIIPRTKRQNKKVHIYKENLKYKIMYAIEIQHLKIQCTHFEGLSGLQAGGPLIWFP